MTTDDDMRRASGRTLPLATDSATPSKKTPLSFFELLGRVIGLGVLVLLAAVVAGLAVRLFHFAAGP